MDKVSDYDAWGPGFRSSQRRNFMVSRLNKRSYCFFFSRAHKSLNFYISTKIFLPNFITQRCLMIKHNQKLIDFLVKYTKFFIISFWNFPKMWLFCKGRSFLISSILNQYTQKVVSFSHFNEDFVTSFHS